MGLKRTRALCRQNGHGRFRRTLVGLKLIIDAVDKVEIDSFRRTLVGLKLNDVVVGQIAAYCFRRTLVGLKLGEVAPAAAPRRFRRTLVGLKLNFRAEAARESTVSDEPLWG